MAAMKIAMVSTMYVPHVFGGTERVVQLLSESLVTQGHEVVVLATAPGRGIRSTEVNGVRVHSIGLINVYWPYGPKGAPRWLEPAWHTLDLWNPWMVSRAHAILEEEAPDVVHTHGWVGFSPRVWREIARLGLPIVHTLHDYRLLCIHATMFRNGQACARQCLGCRAASMLKRGPASDVDVVVGVSRSVLDRHLDAGFFSTAEQEVIRVPVELPPEPAGPDRDGSVVRLGYLGRLDPVKGVELLLAASRDLAADGWELRIAGTGESRFVESLEKLPRHHNVRFVGRVEPNVFLPEVDALIVPSRWPEAAGLVVLEAFAQGVPVLGARRGGIPELIIEGSNGFLFDPDSPAELARLLAELIQHPERLAEFREDCLRAASLHAVARVTDSYLGCYHRAVERSRHTLGIDPDRSLP
jgi:glycosyltransferase involved in cell wall biosynthesis